MKFGHHMLWKGRVFWLLLNQFNRFENFSQSIEPSGAGEWDLSEGQGPAGIQIPENWCAKANLWVLPFSSKDNTVLWCFLRLKVTDIENTLPKIPFWLCSGVPLHLQDGRWHHWHRRALLSLCKFHCLWVWSQVFFKILFPQHCVCKSYFLMDTTSAFQEMMEVKGWLKMLNVCSYWVFFYITDHFS